METCARHSGQDESREPVGPGVPPVGGSDDEPGTPVVVPTRQIRAAARPGSAGKVKICCIPRSDITREMEATLLAQAYRFLLFGREDRNPDGVEQRRM